MDEVAQVLAGLLIDDRAAQHGPEGFGLLGRTLPRIQIGAHHAFTEMLVWPLERSTEKFAMSDDQKMFVPSHPLPPARTGALTAFDAGTRTLEAGFQIAPQFKSLPVDIVFEKDVALQLRDGVTIYVDIFRPAGTEKVPVIVAWSPYGKGQGTSLSVMGVFGLLGLGRICAASSTTS